METSRTPHSLAKLIVCFALFFVSMASPSTVRADARDMELRSGGAAAAGWALTTGAMVALAAWPVATCDQDLACLGTAILSIGSFVLAHPFVASAGVHLLTDAVGDRQPYWHSLVPQLAGDVLAVTAFALAVKLAPARAPEQHQRRMRALVFTASALLSLAGPLVGRPLLENEKGEPALAQMALTF